MDEDENKDTDKKEKKEVIPGWAKKLMEQVDSLTDRLSEQSENKENPVQVPVPAPPIKEEPEPEPEPDPEPEPVPKKRSLLDWLM